MLKMRILIVFIMLAICSVEDILTGYINLIIVSAASAIWFVGLFIIYVMAGLEPDFVMLGTNCLFAVIPGILPVSLSSIRRLYRRWKSHTEFELASKSKLYDSGIENFGIGEGDYYLAVALVLILGPKETFWLIFSAFMLAGIYALYLKLIKKVESSEGFPFVPFMLGGYLVNNMKKASMTIELSLLMPGILSVFILIIFMGYYIHDKCVIQRAAYSSASKVVGCVLSEDEFNRRFEEGIVSIIGKWDISKDIKVSDGEIIIHVKGTMRCLNGVLTHYLSDIIFCVDITENVCLESGPEYVRENR